MAYAEAVGWLAALMSATIAVPQVLRIFRTRTVAGLSLFTWQSLFLAGVGWAVHGFYLERIQVILPNLMLAAASAAVLWQLRRARGLTLAGTWLLPLLVAAGATAADHLLGPVAFAVIMFVPGAIGQVAQFRQIRMADDVTGVSMVTLLINLGSQFVWLGYAIPTGETAMIWVACPLAVLMTAVVLALVVRKRELAAAPAPIRPERDQVESP